MRSDRSFNFPTTPWNASDTERGGQASGQASERASEREIRRIRRARPIYTPSSPLFSSSDRASEDIVDGDDPNLFAFFLSNLAVSRRASLSPINLVPDDGKTTEWTDRAGHLFSLPAGLLREGVCYRWRVRYTTRVKRVLYAERRERGRETATDNGTCLGCDVICTALS